MTQFKIIETDLSDPIHGEHLLFLLNEYAIDIMGGGNPISEYAKKHLIENLKKTPQKHVFIAYESQNPIGIAICFEGFSTFQARPLINIHDFCVIPAFRGMGVAKLLLQKIEEIALSNNCCKITLEVLQGNKRAIKIYQDFGFENYELDPVMGHALFLQKGIGRFE